MTHCKATTNTNTSCQAFRMKGSDFCFTHNPSTRGAHYRAASKGGSVRRIDRIAKLRKIHAEHRRAAFKLLKMREAKI